MIAPNVGTIRLRKQDSSRALVEGRRLIRAASAWGSHLPKRILPVQVSPGWPVLACVVGLVSAFAQALGAIAGEMRTCGQTSLPGVGTS